MSTPRASRTQRPQSGGERVFADDVGRLWSATREQSADEVVVFACITDPRQALRAIAVDVVFRIADVADDMLRAWLRDAPRIGRLT